MMESPGTLRKVIKAGEDILTAHHIENAAHDSFELISDILHIDRSYYFLHAEDEVPSQVYEEYRKRIARRAQHVPLQHITGYTEFWKYRFHVSEHVLIPRQDTEILVEEAIKKIMPTSSVLDMCTGSGCIILSLALETHFRKGIGIDLSKEALAVARENKESLNVKTVEFLESDLFSGLSDELKNEKIDVIVSNPPYIRTSVIEGLTEEVRAHDPMMALDGHENGLYFYDAITKQSVNYIKVGGWLIYEIGYDQADAVSEIMQQCGYDCIETIKDLAGLDRVVLGRFT